MPLSLRERESFGTLPQWDRLEKLGDKSRAILMSRDFKLRKTEGRYVPIPSRFAVYRESDSLRLEVGVDCDAAVTKKVLERYSKWSALGLRSTGLVKDNHFHLILVSLRPVPPSRRTDALPNYSTLADGAMFHKGWGGRGGNYDEDTTIHFIDGVRCESELTARLRTLIETHGLASHA